MPIPERLNPSFASARPPAMDPMEESRKRLIVALDAPDAASAIRLVNQLENRCDWFKVGLELFIAAGPAVIETPFTSVVLAIAYAAVYIILLLSAAVWIFDKKEI